MLSERNEQSGGFNLAVTLVFLGAIIHTFLAGRFERYSHKLALRYKEKLKESNFRVMHPEERLAPPSFISWGKWKPCSAFGSSPSCSCAGNTIPLKTFQPT